MSASDAEFLDEWSDRWLSAWNSQEVEAIVAMCDTDLRLEDPALPGAVHGIAGITSFAVDTFETFPDLRLSALEPPCPSRDDGAFFFYRFAGTMNGPWRPLGTAPTGCRVDFRGITRWEFSGALLISWVTFYDNLDAARQMGIVPQHGSRADRLLARLQHLQARAQRRANHAAT